MKSRNDHIVHIDIETLPVTHRIFKDKMYPLNSTPSFFFFLPGSFSVVVPIYVSEISSPEIRGSLGTLFQIFTVLGIFSMYVIGTYVSWKGLGSGGRRGAVSIFV